MTIKMGAAYRALARRYAELELRKMTADEVREWYSVSAQMTAIELEYPDGFYRPIATGAMLGTIATGAMLGTIAAVADAESYEFELRWAGGYSAPELG